MSGGSYDYLCYDSPDDLAKKLYQLNQMRDRLAALGYAEDAAYETEEIIVILRQMMVRVETRQKRLNGVWQAVEWWDSADSGEDHVKEALVHYRADTKPTS